MNTRNASAGFTLIEVLITILVAGIGLLAVAGLQAMSKKINYDAVQRTAASALAQSMVESLRGNPGALAFYVTSDAAAVNAPVDCAAPATRCEPEELALYDLWRWSQSLAGVEARVEAENQDAGGLVDATGCVFDGGTAGLYVVVVSWRGITPLEDEAPGSNDPRRCGYGSGRYDDPRHDGADDRMQRSLSLEAFVANPNAP